MAKKKNPDLKVVETERAEDTNRISVNQLDKIMDGIDDNIATMEWSGIEVHIKKNISLADMVKFVRDVTNSCFAEDTGEYLPEIKDFAIRANLMEVYANFTLPANLEKRYRVVMLSGAPEMIANHIDHLQYHDILDAIDKKIETRAAANVEMVHQKLDTLVENFNKLYETLNGIFGGVTQEDLSGLVEAMKNSNFTEEGIVNAFLNQQKAGAE